MLVRRHAARLHQLTEAALNLGMSLNDAQHYAAKALAREADEQSQHAADRERAYEIDHGGRS